MTQPEPRESSEKGDQNMFQILKSAAAGDGGAARLGRLAVVNRRVMETPNYIGVTSRGAIPHLTPDNVTKHTTFDAAYMAVEDFLEKDVPPIYSLPKDSPRNLHKFTALSPDRAVILGPRRFPAVTTPVGNGANHMSIFTSTGFRNLSVAEFASTVEVLQPDITIPPADLFHTSKTPSAKRQTRMVDRTEEWVDDLFHHLPKDSKLRDLGISVFAPVLPVEYPIQWDYLRHLAEDLIDNISGLAIYDVNLLPELENYPSVGPLPKLSLDPPKSPHDVLRQISLGIDICTVSFINSISDAGIALTFTFPPLETPGEVRPLGINMWDPEHITSVVPLVEGCNCYTCANHHRAFLKHLLNAKEMLGWNLLQIHNHQVMTDFFTGIRAVLKRGGQPEFEKYRHQFSSAYEPELPKGTGQRPRARGYHFKSLANQSRINEPPWQAFDNDQEQSLLASPAAGMEPQRSTTETPLIPDESSQALAEKGFGEVQDK